MAGEGELESAAEGKTIDRGDDRLAEPLDEVAQTLSELRALLGLKRVLGGELGDVGAGGERRPLRHPAGEDDAADGPSVPEGRERRDELAQGGVVEGIELVRPADLDVGEGAVGGDRDVFVAHGTGQLTVSP